MPEIRSREVSEDIAQEGSALLIGSKDWVIWGRIRLISLKKPMSVHTIKYLDPLVVSKLKNIEIKAKLIVEGFITGLHRSPYHGFSRRICGASPL